MYSCGPLHRDGQRRDAQLEHTYSSSVQIVDVARKTCQKQWTIGRGGKRGSIISVQIAWHDDDYCDAHNVSADMSFGPHSTYRPKHEYKNKDQVNSLNIPSNNNYQALSQILPGYPEYGTKSDGYALSMLGFWRMLSAPLLPSLLGRRCYGLNRTVN